MFKKKKLITALTKTANDLEQGCEYEWGHMGRCNAGCLVQNLISKTDKQISNMFNNELDEWSEYAKEYCIGTNDNVQDLFDRLHSFGLSHQDIIHLEYLSDPNILNQMPENRRYLQKNNAQDVSDYMRCFAQQLESV